ncbi:hypothetical protein HDZ31DRAFT_76548 [Schizophyllum fasciatum]
MDATLADLSGSEIVGPTFPFIEDISIPVWETWAPAIRPASTQYTEEGNESRGTATGLASLDQPDGPTRRPKPRRGSKVDASWRARDGFRAHLAFECIKVQDTDDLHPIPHARLLQTIIGNACTDEDLTLGGAWLVLQSTFHAAAPGHPSSFKLLHSRPRYFKAFLSHTIFPQATMETTLFGDSLDISPIHNLPSLRLHEMSITLEPLGDVVATTLSPILENDTVSEGVSTVKIGETTTLASPDLTVPDASRSRKPRSRGRGKQRRTPMEATMVPINVTRPEAPLRLPSTIKEEDLAEVQGIGAAGAEVVAGETEAKEVKPKEGGQGRGKKAGKKNLKRKHANQDAPSIEIKDDAAAGEDTNKEDGTTDKPAVTKKSANHRRRLAKSSRTREAADGQAREEVQSATGAAASVTATEGKGPHNPIGSANDAGAVDSAALADSMAENAHTSQDVNEGGAAAGHPDTDKSGHTTTRVGGRKGAADRRKKAERARAVKGEGAGETNPIEAERATMGGADRAAGSPDTTGTFTTTKGAENLPTDRAGTTTTAKALPETHQGGDTETGSKENVGTRSNGRNRKRAQPRRWTGGAQEAPTETGGGMSDGSMRAMKHGDDGNTQAREGGSGPVDSATPSATADTKSADVMMGGGGEQAAAGGAPNAAESAVASLAEGGVSGSRRRFWKGRARGGRKTRKAVGQTADKEAGDAKGSTVDGTADSAPDADRGGAVSVEQAGALTVDRAKVTRSGTPSGKSQARRRRRSPKRGGAARGGRTRGKGAKEPETGTGGGPVLGDTQVAAASNADSAGQTSVASSTCPSGDDAKTHAGDEHAATHVDMGAHAAIPAVILAVT